MTLEEKKLKYFEFKRLLEETANVNYITLKMFQLMNLESSLQNFDYAFEIKNPSKEFLKILELSGTSVYKLKKMAETSDILIETKNIEGGKTLKFELDSFSTSITIFNNSIIIEKIEKEFENDKKTIKHINYVSIGGENYFFSDASSKVVYNSTNNTEQDYSYEDIKNIKIYDIKNNKLVYENYYTTFISNGKKSSDKCEFTDFWDKSNNTYYTCMKKDNDIMPIIKNTGEKPDTINIFEWNKNRVYKKRLESDWEFSSKKTPYEYQLLNQYKKLESNCKIILQATTKNKTM